MSKKIKEFEVLEEFACIQDDKQRRDLLHDNAKDIMDNETYNVPLSDDQETELIEQERHSFDEVLRISDEIKALNTQKKGFNDFHKTAHATLKNGVIEESGRLYVFNDPDSEILDVIVNDKGIIIDRKKRDNATKFVYPNNLKKVV